MSEESHTFLCSAGPRHSREATWTEPRNDAHERVQLVQVVSSGQAVDQGATAGLCFSCPLAAGGRGGAGGESGKQGVVANPRTHGIINAKSPRKKAKYKLPTYSDFRPTHPLEMFKKKEGGAQDKACPRRSERASRPGWARGSGTWGPVGPLSCTCTLGRGCDSSRLLCCVVLCLFCFVFWRGRRPMRLGCTEIEIGPFETLVGTSALAQTPRRRSPHYEIRRSLTADAAGSVVPRGTTLPPAWSPPWWQCQYLGTLLGSPSRCQVVTKKVLRLRGRQA